MLVSQVKQCQKTNLKIDVKFINGLELYLKYDSKNIFHGRYDPIEDADTVHFRKISEDDGRFYITNVTKSASAYPDFDPDLHCVGAVILWKKSCCCSLMRITLNNP